MKEYTITLTEDDFNLIEMTLKITQKTIEHYDTPIEQRLFLTLHAIELINKIKNTRLINE